MITRYAGFSPFAAASTGPTFLNVQLVPPFTDTKNIRTVHTLVYAFEGAATPKPVSGILRLTLTDIAGGNDIPMTQQFQDVAAGFTPSGEQGIWLPINTITEIKYISDAPLIIKARQRINIDFTQVSFNTVAAAIGTFNFQIVMEFDDVTYVGKYGVRR